MINFVRKGKSTKDATATASDIIYPKTAYGQNGKIIGTMSNNGQLTYNVSTSQQTIPSGYTSGGTIAASPQTQEDYDDCLIASQKILTNPLDLLHLNSSKIIDLGIEVNLNHYYKLKFKDTSINAYEAYVGTSVSGNIFLARNGSTGALSKSNISAPWTVPLTPTELVLIFNKGTGENIWLGSTGGSSAGNADYDLYYFKDYNENDELVHEFIPVQKSNNTIGLLDTITNNFIEY